jgi:hypothetical protein
MAGIELSRKEKASAVSGGLFSGESGRLFL